MKLRGILRKIPWCDKQGVCIMSKYDLISVVLSVISLISSIALGIVTYILNRKKNKDDGYDRCKKVFLETRHFFENRKYMNIADREELRHDINNAFNKKTGLLFDAICIDLSELNKLQFDMTEVMDLLKHENFEEYMWIQNMDWSTDDRAELTRAKKFLDDLCYMSSDTEIDGGMRELSYREIEKEIEELKNKISSEQKILYSIMEKKLK